MTLPGPVQRDLEHSIAVLTAVAGQDLDAAYEYLEVITDPDDLYALVITIASMALSGVEDRGLTPAEFVEALGRIVAGGS